MKEGIAKLKKDSQKKVDTDYFDEEMEVIIDLVSKLGEVNVEAGGINQELTKQKEEAAKRK